MIQKDGEGDISSRLCFQLVGNHKIINININHKLAGTLRKIYSEDLSTHTNKIYCMIKVGLGI